MLIKQGLPFNYLEVFPTSHAIYSLAKLMVLKKVYRRVIINSNANVKTRKHTLKKPTTKFMKSVNFNYIC